MSFQDLDRIAGDLARKNPKRQVVLMVSDQAIKTAWGWLKKLRKHIKKKLK